MKEDKLLAEKIKEEKIIFSPYRRDTIIQGIGFYAETTFQGMESRVRIGEIEYVPQLSKIPPISEIQTKDKNLSETVRLLTSFLTQEMQETGDSQKALENLQKRLGIELKRVSY